MENAFSVQGKVALITGSSRGIGSGIAKELAKRGAHVIISSRKIDACEVVVKEIASQGGSAEAYACHIGKMDDIQSIYDHIRDKHGKLDVLVNNAVISPWRSIVETDPGLFDKAVSVNLKGYWFMSSAAVPLMSEGGSIVNISSITGMHPARNLGLYSMLKTALIGMSRSFALEHGAQNIRVNTILPGLIETDLTSTFDDKTKAKILRSVPLSRIGLPSDIANAIVFLASDASAYVTGASLVIDGGMTIGNAGL